MSFDLTKITFKSLLNSIINCLHAPHGKINLLLLFAMAIALNLLSPSEIAFAKATLSAHKVSEYDAHSIFAPVNILSVSVSNAAPTLKFEYGE